MHSASGKEHSADDGDAKQSIATLLLVSRGRLPSWRTTNPSVSQSDNTASTIYSAKNNATTRKRNYDFHDDWGLSIEDVLYLFVLSTCAKVLLFLAYHSTDLYVHRHWKAVTQHLRISEWYYDDRFVATRHTLDYPPGFMLLEWFLARLTRLVLSIISMGASDSDNQHCLSLLPDSQVESSPGILSTACIASLRTTVIVSDIVLWFSAWVVTRVVLKSNSTSNTVSAQKRAFARRLFVLLVFHPALLWLDHVHFQYNGCLMGILMLSLACLMQANNQQHNDGFYHGMAAALFAILLTLKHLYLTCSLWYIVYLLRRYCMPEKSSPWYAGAQRLFLLALIAATVFAAPFLVFVLAVENEDRYDWFIQVFSRLFPFQRGLVHDYWAGNVWAVYMAIIKVIRFSLRPFLNDNGIQFFNWLERDAVSPGVSGICLLLGQLPGLRLAFQAAAQRSNLLLLQSFTYVTLVSFLFQYHAHEKAIVTALFPATLWAALVFGTLDNTKPTDTVNASFIGLFIQTFTAISVLGLFPLLFRSEELLFKVTSYVGFLAALKYFVTINTESVPSNAIVWHVYLALFGIVAVTIVQLDVLPVQTFFGRYEFAPLAITSLVCATGNLILFAQLLTWTMRATRTAINS